MRIKVDFLLSPHKLYHDLVQHFSQRESFSERDDHTFIIGGLRFRLQDKGGGSGGIGTEKENQSIFAYLDDRYAAVKDYAQKGWRTIWLNREEEIISDAIPVHDGEVCAFGDLYDAISLLQKPSLQQCFDWWDVWEVPENIRQHSTTVAWGAYVLAVMMRHQGIAVDPILAHRGGLLHDIDKIATLRENRRHGGMGADFLLEKGYPKVAAIVRDHIMHRILEPNADDRPWEDKLVFFVDKLVEGDEIITFDKRLEALKARYPAYRTTMESTESGIWDLSDQICSILFIPDHQKLITTLHELKDN